MHGPGGYYNIGNALALTTGLAVQGATMSAGDSGGLDFALSVARAYLIGSPGATALTLAILIFFASGEMYHRAWADGSPPDAALNRWGDILSAAGALVLTVALAAFGDVVLAAVSGVLLAGGKLGSALVQEDYSADRQSNPWPNRFRVTVLLSRVPAMAALSLELARTFAGPGPVSVAPTLLSAVMLLCYVLWARADLLLFASIAGKPASAPSADPAALRP